MSHTYASTSRTSSASTRPSPYPSSSPLSIPNWRATSINTNTNTDPSTTATDTNTPGSVLTTLSAMAARRASNYLPRSFSNRGTGTGSAAAAGDAAQGPERTRSLRAMLADARAELASRERGRGLLPPQPSAQTERVWQAPPTQQQQQQQQQPAPFARYLNQQHSASLAQPPSTATPSTTATPRHLQHQHQHQPYLFSNTPASTAHAPNPSSTTQTSPASTTHLPTRTSGTNTSTNTSVNVNVNVNVNGTGSVNVNTATHHHPHFRSKRVCTLTCRHCTNEVCSRGMKAILLGDLRVELFSTDSPPSKVQLVELDYMTRNCRCRIRDVACLGCGNVIGYHVTQPCDRCLESCNNGHFWMFLSEGVTSTDRMDLSGTKHLVWAQLPVVEMDAGGAGARESVGEEVVCR